MSSLIGPGELGRFRDLVRRKLGLEHDDNRLAELAEVLRQRLDATGARDVETYARLADGGDELQALIARLTVGETYFFRNADHFRALAEHVLPERVRRGAGQRRLRVLSLGCATGEEPYSIAILLRDRFHEVESWDLELWGVDVNRASLARAAAAHYTAWALRATPAELVARWFHPAGRDHVLDDRVRGMVHFVEHNLADPAAPWWGADRWDLVLCRNVLMYLTPGLRAAVLERLAAAIAPDGYLFLGHAETLRGTATGFRLCHTHDTFYYQRGDGADDTLMALPRPRVSPPAAGPDGGVGWFEEIERASRRIASLSTAPPSEETAVVTGAAEAAPALDHVRSLFEQERVEEALAALDALPAAAADHPDALLLRAVLCTNRGNLAEAEAACARLLAHGVPDAGAHYLIALGRESAGDVAGAADHDRRALVLDPGFAMPRLHLGLLARRGGAIGDARRELSAALVLLERDDGARLALFGGGFGRDALRALCRAELAACGGGP